MFSCQGSLNRHIATIHNKIKAFSCPKCNEAFTEKGTLTRHILSKHDAKSLLEFNKAEFEAEPKMPSILQLIYPVRKI